MKENMENPLRLKSLNHISIVCSSVEKSLDFYQNVLGFFPIRRPGSFDFRGAWLFNYGIGIHLLQAEDPDNLPKCESMTTVEKRLKEMEIEYVKCRVEEGGVHVDQLFFHDPDGMMIEICNCDNLPVIPLSGEPLRPAGLTCTMQQQQQIQQVV
nr:metallothiol transferase FosB-like [Ipomoea batatas]